MRRLICFLFVGIILLVTFSGVKTKPYHAAWMTGDTLTFMRNRLFAPDFPREIGTVRRYWLRGERTEWREDTLIATLDTIESHGYGASIEYRWKIDSQYDEGYGVEWSHFETRVEMRPGYMNVDLGGIGEGLYKLPLVAGQGAMIDSSGDYILSREEVRLDTVTIMGKTIEDAFRVTERYMLKDQSSTPERLSDKNVIRSTWFVRRLGIARQSIHYFESPGFTIPAGTDSTELIDTK